MLRTSGLSLLVTLSLACWTSAEARADALRPHSITSDSAACQRTGCSGQVCADRSVITTCEWREEYSCYQTAACARQPDGQCGWTQTAELALCLHGGTPIPDDGGALYPQVQGCLDSGGSIGQGQCCQSTRPFPNTCLIGACGCSPDYSHEVPVCDCPAGSCFDGMGCTSPNPPTPPTPPANPKAKACLKSGGTIDKALCCESTGDFPNTCLIGACGCSLDYSHEVDACACPAGLCFNGKKCVPHTWR